MIKLYELRTEKGLSQRSIASKLHISQGTYNNWENGKTEPSISQLIELSNFFEVSIDYIVGNSDETGIINYNKGLTDLEKNILDNLGKLSPKLQNDILQLIRDISK